MNPIPQHPAPVDDLGREYLPAKKGDWIQDRANPGKVAKVKDVYWDSYSGEFLVDLFLYDRDGDRTGRESPAVGGPRTFEPSCRWADWVRIDEPRFPIALRWVDLGDGRRTAMYHSNAKELPDLRRVTRNRPKAVPPSAAQPVPTDYDPRLEAASRRMAAEELRSMARKTGVKELRERAASLEDEAENIEPRRS